MIEKLIVYKKSLTLIKVVYSLIETNKNLKKDFSLIDQTKKAAVSVATNISEGYGRSKKYFKNYLGIASGTANEIITLLQIIELVYNINTKQLQKDYQLLAKQINALSSSF
jgi:four helix bundle protein